MALADYLPTAYQAGQTLAAVRAAPKQIMNAAGAVGAAIPGAVNDAALAATKGVNNVVTGVQTAGQNFDAGLSGAPMPASMAAQPVTAPSAVTANLPALVPPAAAATPAPAVLPSAIVPTAGASGSWEAPANPIVPRGGAMYGSDRTLTGSIGPNGVATTGLPSYQDAIQTGVDQQQKYAGNWLDKVFGKVNFSSDPVYAAAQKLHLAQSLAGAGGVNNFASLQQAGVTGQTVAATAEQQRALEAEKLYATPHPAGSSTTYYKDTGLPMGTTTEAVVPIRGGGFAPVGGSAKREAAAVQKPQDLQHFIAEAKKANPNASDADLTAYYTRTYGAK